MWAGSNSKSSTTVDRSYHKHASVINRAGDFGVDPFGRRAGICCIASSPWYGKEYSGTKSFEQLKELLAGEQLRQRAIAEVPERLMSKGPANSPVVIEFFADLQSPVSRPASGVLDQLMARYPENVRLQFRNFPLAFHPQAGLAHDAAMAAAREGHFWEMEAYLLDHQDSLREQDLIAYAGKLGIGETKFAETIQQHRYSPRVEADVMDGLKRGQIGRAHV